MFDLNLKVLYVFILVKSLNNFWPLIIPVTIQISDLFQFKLDNLSKYLNAKINLINLNPHSKIPYEPVSSKKLMAIKQKIQRSKCLVTVRFKKGQDIAAACGQLGESIIK